jgi:hypothetical protein
MEFCVQNTVRICLKLKLAQCRSVYKHLLRNGDAAAVVACPFLTDQKTIAKSALVISTAAAAAAAAGLIWHLLFNFNLDLNHFGFHML